MTIAPERPADLSDIDFDVYPDEVEPASTFFPDLNEVNGSLIFTVEGTREPESGTREPLSGTQEPEIGTPGALPATTASYTHTVADSGPFTVIGYTHGDGHTVYALPRPTLTPENIYDAVRQTQHEESVSNWAGMLQWICECTPSRGQMFGSPGFQQAPTHRPPGVAESAQQRIFDTWNTFFGFEDTEQQERELSERCNQALATQEPLSSCWEDLSHALGMVPAEHVRTARSFFEQVPELPHAPHLQYGSEALENPPVDATPSYGITEWAKDMGEQHSKLSYVPVAV